METRQSLTYPFSHTGEISRLLQQKDWSKTSLGAIENWSPALKNTISLMLASKFPMIFWWGEELIQFYNESYRNSMGAEGRHPHALGVGLKEGFPDRYEIVYPLVKAILDGGPPTWIEDGDVPVFRNNRFENSVWTYGYSPLYESDGSIAGVLVVCQETTRQVATLKKLAESEGRFINLIRDAAFGFIAVEGNELKVKVVNEAYCQLTALTQEQLLGNKLFDVIKEDEKQFFEKIIRGVLQTGKEFHLNDFPYYSTSGSEPRSGFLNINYQPYREDDGKIMGVMIVCQDVTQQVMDRKKLEESEQLVRSIVDNAPFPIGVYTGREMRIRLVNQAILDVWGKGNDVVGKTYFEVLPELESQNIYPQLDSVFMTGIPFHARNQRVDLVVDNRLQSFYFNYSFTPMYDTSGKIYGVMNTAAEVTDIVLAKERVERSERNLRRMIMQSPVAMCILMGSHHEIEVANDQMISLWGKPRDSVMGKPVFEALPDSREQGLEALLKHVYETRESFSASEMPVVLNRNGIVETVYQSFVYEPYVNAEDQTIGVLVVSIDVTSQVLARKKIEEVVAERTRELATANQNLGKINEELAQFAYIASHDLQEPVRKVGTFLELLEESLQHIDSKSQSYIDRMKSASSRMLMLIRDVLAYSQVTSQVTDYVPVDLKSVVNDIVADFELLIEEKQARVKTIDLPVLQAMPLQMSQLFGNLISNALKFTARTRNPEIIIQAKLLSGEEVSQMSTLHTELSYYKIEVKDNGIGFGAQYKNQIFSIFKRLHSKKEFEGTGIGLAICQKIVDNHHGAISADAVEGEGSTFTIYLPVKQVSR